MSNIIQVEGLGEIVEVSGNYSDSLSRLASQGAKLISPRDEAYARIRAGPKLKDIGKLDGTLTSAGFEYAEGELPLLNLDSRLLSPELARLAVEANRQERLFSTDSTREYEESFEIAKEDEGKNPQERRVMVMPSKKTFGITQRENYEVLQFLLKDQADEYFRLNGLIQITTYLIDERNVPKKGTALIQLLFSSFDYRSDLDGNNRSLHYNGRLRGVRSQNFPSGNK